MEEEGKAEERSKKVHSGRRKRRKGKRRKRKTGQDVR